MRVGSLFSGIEGFGLGFGLHGAEVAWQAEVDPFAHRILKLRFPEAEQLGDVREIDAGAPKVDALAGGFPCQDLSVAGLGAGLDGDRSGLWTEFARIIGAVAPEVVFIENVPALLSRGFERVIADLTALGYGVEWDCLPAAAFGAPHLRDRVWVVAHRLGEPCVFGRPSGLFPWPVFVRKESGWLKWPRAGWAVDVDHVLELQPLAPIGACKRGAVLPTPAAVEYGSSQNGINRTRPSAGTPSLGTMARHGLWPTPHGMCGPYDRAAGPSGNELGRGVNEAEREAWPTLRASDGERGGRGDLTARANGSTSRRRERPLLPTPTAQDSKNDGGPSQHRRNSLPLNALVQRVPTPQASDALGGRVDAELGGRRPSGAKRSVSLGSAVAHGLVPTPTAGDSRASGSRSLNGSAAHPGTSLTDYVREDRAKAGQLAMLPTPRAADSVSGPDYARADREGSGGDDLSTHVAKDGERGQLNPEWVEWLMGFPVGWTDPGRDRDSLTWWDWTAEPPGLARVSTGGEHRRARLFALGNALVPVAPAFLLGRYLAARARHGVMAG